MACCFLTYSGDALAGNVHTDFIAYSRNVKLIELCGSDQSRSIKITAWGSASQGKNDTVFLDKLVVGNTYMLMNLEWARGSTSIVHLLRQCIITAELLVLATIRIS